LINEQAAAYRAVNADCVNALIAERLGPENRASLMYVPRDGVESEPMLAAAVSAG
jgi:hypothetical protein